MLGFQVYKPYLSSGLITNTLVLPKKNRKIISINYNKKRYLSEMTVMVEKKISNPIILALRSVNGIKNIEIDNIDDKDVNVKTFGGFEFEGLNYWFYYSENKNLVMLEVSFIFTFEKIKEKNNLIILEAINNFNLKFTGIKASLSEIRLDAEEVDVEFGYGVLNSLEYIKGNKYDLESGISILSYVPKTMSSLFLEKNIVHDKVTDENKNEDE